MYLLYAIYWILACFSFEYNGNDPHTPESVAISPIPNYISLIIVCFILITIGWLLVEIRRIGGTGIFSVVMNRYRALNNLSTEEEGRLPWLLNQFINLIHVLFWLYGFHLIRFYSKLSRLSKVLNFIILCGCCMALLLSAQRTPAVHDMIACFIMFHLLRIQKQGGYRVYRMKSLVRIVILLVLLFAAFFLSKKFIGRIEKTSEMNAAEYIAYYTGSQYIAFDKYLQHPPYPSGVFGKYTFRNINRFLIQYGFTDMPPYTGHLEFRSVGGGYTSNVYTFLRVYHYDFGELGTYILHFLSIFLVSLFYEYVKKKRGNIGILIFSVIYHTIVMSFFTERFYSSLIGLSYVKMFLELLILYELLVRKRIRLVFHQSNQITMS